jgi:hypothetical protein
MQRKSKMGRYIEKMRWGLVGMGMQVIYTAAF